MPDLILHHYDLSPFAHKARLMMGLKGLAWKSVVIPMIMPKPDLMPLTGGYRKTPILQIGADLYCDTQLIAAELERRKPSPTFYPHGGVGMAQMLTAWADQNMFLSAANYVLGAIADKMPPAFFADRAAMRGAPPPDIEKLKAAAPRMLSAVQMQLDLLESLLADGRQFVLGDKPGLADLSIHHIVWFMKGSGRRAAAAVEPYRAINAWAARVDAIGQGQRSELDSKAALAIAKAATPEAHTDSIDVGEFGPKLGQKVAVQPEDKTPEPVIGEVVLIRANEVAIKRHDAQVGDVVVHFPRLGYIVRPV
ncbi:MAG: glutathione S-transferase family protein [Alphaproteobacteria bacterium]